MMTANTSHMHDVSIRAASRDHYKAMHFESQIALTDAQGPLWMQKHASIGDVQTSVYTFLQVYTSVMQDQPTRQSKFDTPFRKGRVLCTLYIDF